MKIHSRPSSVVDGRLPWHLHSSRLMSCLSPAGALSARKQRTHSSRSSSSSSSSSRTSQLWCGHCVAPIIIFVCEMKRARSDPSPLLRPRPRPLLSLSLSLSRRKQGRPSPSISAPRPPNRVSYGRTASPPSPPSPPTATSTASTADAQDNGSGVSSKRKASWGRGLRSIDDRSNERMKGLLLLCAFLTRSG